MSGTPQRNPKQQAVACLPEQVRGHGTQPLDINDIDLVPIRMKRIRFSVRPGAGPRVQNAGPPLPPVNAQVEERLADVKDTFEANTERSNLVCIVLLRSPDGFVQRLAVLVRERPVVCHQERRAAEQTVLRVRPAVFQHRELESLRARVVGILNKLPEQRASIPDVLVDVSQESLDRLDLIERTSDDAGVGSDINVGHVSFVCDFVHGVQFWI